MAVDQKKRHDAEHIKILVPCVRGFLRELLKEAECGDLPVKGWLGAVNQILKAITSGRGRKAGKKFKIDWPKTLPAKEIESSKHEKIIHFREERLARVEW